MQVMRLPPGSMSYIIQITQIIQIIQIYLSCLADLLDHELYCCSAVVGINDLSDVRTLSY